MKRTSTETKKVSEQFRDYVGCPESKVECQAGEYGGDFTQVISTGSTLLDLAISGTAIRGGGLPGGIMVEIFGPPSCGKTVLLCQIAGNVQKQGGDTMYHDPEGRLSTTFAALFGMKVRSENYQMPNTVPEIFEPIGKWNPDPEDKIHGIFADSLAALSTKMELEQGDTMGARRAKEFSEGLRKSCRILRINNFLLVCSNQIRDTMDSSPYSEKWATSGGKAIPHYSSLRLKCYSPRKIARKAKIAGKEQSRIVGIETEVYVYKSSLDHPYRTAPIAIIYDYGIDDIKQNLQFVKTNTGATKYFVDGTSLSQGMDDSIAQVEAENMEEKLKEEVIYLWEEIEAKFKQKRKPRL